MKNRNKLIDEHEEKYRQVIIEKLCSMPYKKANKIIEDGLTMALLEDAKGTYSGILKILWKDINIREELRKEFELIARQKK
jgi:hypothetical protein